MARNHTCFALAVRWRGALAMCTRWLHSARQSMLMCIRSVLQGGVMRRFCDLPKRAFRSYRLGTGRNLGLGILGARQLLVDFGHGLLATVGPLRRAVLDIPNIVRLLPGKRRVADVGRRQRAFRLHSAALAIQGPGRTRRSVANAARSQTEPEVVVTSKHPQCTSMNMSAQHLMCTTGVRLVPFVPTHPAFRQRVGRQTARRADGSSCPE